MLTLSVACLPIVGGGLLAAHVFSVWINSIDGRSDCQLVRDAKQLIPHFWLDFPRDFFSHVALFHSE